MKRVEGASGRLPAFILLYVHQVEQAAQIRPLVEPHLGVAGFDDLNQASDEVDGVGTVCPLAVSSVYLQGDRLVHAFFLLVARVRLGGRGEAPAEPARLPRPYHPDRHRRLSVGERYVKIRRVGGRHPAGREFLNTMPAQYPGRRLIHALGSLCRTTTGRPTHAEYEASEAILVAIGGGSMHDSANGLLRIILPRTSVNKGC